MNHAIASFFDYLRSVTDFPPEELENIRSISGIKAFKKGDLYIRQGDMPKDFAYVYKGLFRITYLCEKGKEFTKAFFPENTIVSSYSALLQERESYFSIEALEDSTLVVVDYNGFTKLFENRLCWHNFLIALLNKAYCVKEAREREFLLFDAQQRYESFLATYPHLENRIKQHVLASYLGITPVSLSRLKKH